MREQIQQLLDRKVLERDQERARVKEILLECSREHVHPAHDYWNHLNDLENQVKILERVLQEDLS